MSLMRRHRSTVFLKHQYPKPLPALTRMSAARPNAIRTLELPTAIAVVNIPTVMDLPENPATDPTGPPEQELDLPHRISKKSTSLSSAGDEPSCSGVNNSIEGTGANMMTPAKPAPELGKLHKRRASMSPDKFNAGRFGPLPIDTSQPPPKKRCLETGTGTTRTSAYTPKATSATDLGAMSKASTELTEPMTCDYDSDHSHFSPLSLDENGLGLCMSIDIINAKPPEKFNLFNAFLQRPELLIIVVGYLNLPSLLALYRISKPFHYLFDCNETSFILACLRNLAPGAHKIYPWHCFGSLCTQDVTPRYGKNWLGKPSMANLHIQDVRNVPSLRWLQMVVYRRGVCHDMLIRMATQGLLCPPGTLDALQRIWFILDLPVNKQRTALLTSKTYFPDKVLERMMFFLIKLDMRFTHPLPPSYPAGHPDQRRFPNRVAGAHVSGVLLRKTLLAEKSLTPLWRVLRGWSWDSQLPQTPMTRLDLIRLWVRHHYTPHPLLPYDVKKLSIMGIPWWEVGTAGLERAGIGISSISGKQVSFTDPSIVGKTATLDRHRQAQIEKSHDILYPHRRRITLAYEKKRERLLRPEELLLRESLRRGIQFNAKWLDMMLYGVCDEFGRPIPLKTEKQLVRASKCLPETPVELRSKFTVVETAEEDDDFEEEYPSEFDSDSEEESDEGYDDNMDDA